MEISAPSRFFNKPMMIESVITLKPKSKWRRGMTMDKIIDELNRTVDIPGLTNAWTMPIRTRIDMLSTGMKTPVGIKVMGANLVKLGELTDFRRVTASSGRDNSNTCSKLPPLSGS